MKSFAWANEPQCDGSRPDCGACKGSRRKCDYASQPGWTRTAALKSKVSQLRADNESLLNLYSRLRDGSTPEARDLFERIRSGGQALDTSSLSRDSSETAVQIRMAMQEPGTPEHDRRRTSIKDSNLTGFETCLSSAQASAFCKG